MRRFPAVAGVPRRAVPERRRSLPRALLLLLHLLFSPPLPPSLPGAVGWEREKSGVVLTPGWGGGGSRFSRVSALNLMSHSSAPTADRREQKEEREAGKEWSNRNRRERERERLGEREREREGDGEVGERESERVCECV